MAAFNVEDYNHIKDLIHPHINACINHYRHRKLIILPAFQMR